MDWALGEYERTARQLEPAAFVAVDALRPHHGELILDVGCGTGNAALLCAKRGAQVTGIDSSKRLVQVCEQRAATDGLDGKWLIGDAEQLPFDGPRFDGVVSVFGVIFARAGRVAAAEMIRVCRPGARIVVTAWASRGPLAEIGALLAQATGQPDRADGDDVAWSEPDVLRELFGPETEVTEHRLGFTSTSPAAWVLENATYHPLWLSVRNQIAEDRFEDLLDEMTAVLAAANEDDAGMRVMSDYVVARARI